MEKLTEAKKPVKTTAAIIHCSFFIGHHGLLYFDEVRCKCGYKTTVASPQECNICITLW